MTNIVLVGYGSLAHSMMRGFSSCSYLRETRFFIFGRHFEKAQVFASQYKNTQAIPSLQRYISNDSILILCIKPQGLQSLKIDESFNLLYSVLAGITIQTLKNHFPQAQNITRAMPNVGASFQGSSTSLFHQGDEQSKSLALQLTSSFGSATLLDHENLIDSSIATNGSSPAFLSLVAEALIEAGVREGIPYQQSQELVYSTFCGFAKLLSSHSPQEIKALVTSPGGTTAEGLAHLENHAFKGILQEACHKSVLKARGKL